MKLNNKGVTLLELLAVIVIMGILMQTAFTMMNLLNRSVAKAKTAQESLQAAQVTNPAVAPGADSRTYLKDAGTCYVLDGTTGWSVQRNGSTTVKVFRSLDCAQTSYLGTLTAQTNPTYDDDITNTFWNVSGSDQSLRVLVRKLNLKQP